MPGTKKQSSEAAVRDTRRKTRIAPCRRFGLPSTPGNGVLPEGGTVYREETVCLNPADATKPQTLSFTMHPGPAPCTFTYPDEEAFIDNVRLTTDPACPSE